MVSKVSRIRGWLLIILGTCLSVGMVVIGAFLVWTIAHNDRPRGTHWTGSHEVTVKTLRASCDGVYFWCGRGGRRKFSAAARSSQLAGNACFIGTGGSDVLSWPRGHTVGPLENASAISVSRQAFNRSISCCDSRLRCGWQRDREARARGRLQRALTFFALQRKQRGTI